MPVDPAQLRMLALVEAHGSLAGAAAELGLTPGAVTGQVTKAERDWGVPLVHRGPRGARLTEAGTALARRGDEIDEACRLAELELAATRAGARPRLRIGSFVSVATRLLPDAMTALRHRRPDSDLTILEGTSRELSGRVADGALDLAVVGTYDEQVPELPVWLTATRLLTDPMVRLPARGAPARAQRRRAGPPGTAARRAVGGDQGGRSRARAVRPGVPRARPRPARAVPDGVVRRRAGDGRHRPGRRRAGPARHPTHTGRGAPGAGAAPPAPPALGAARSGHPAHTAGRRAGGAAAGRLRRPTAGVATPGRRPAATTRAPMVVARLFRDMCGPFDEVRLTGDPGTGPAART